ncbi:beta-N-acetylhexosaminidase [Acetatifactor muris]|uniref:beta-N-acetylhexosaminidase n=1 Tax=Acetatifactor muris TaxID=879566 RepID=A0A2K4ZCE3_9FIRM|nr:glycoside hydrolase family 3 N-terminal domain-containing protein [Acetatifactor muris]MCR2046305.1 beta-N-acetylhexosaminidase [Acetatifactor muris]SOY28127.1 putative lipoprotein YbbD precursor [Acetatifactor muris]
MGNNDKLQNRRELRRKRRVRNQIISYVILTVLISAAAAGIVFVTGYLLSDSKTTEQEAENKELIDDMLADEESIATPEPVPEETVTPEPAPTPEEKLEELVEAKVAAMSLEDKVMGLFIVAPEAITGVSTVIQAGEGTQQALNQYPVGGLIYFKQNIQSEEQLKTMLENTAQYAKYPLFLAVDEEGGSVSRVAASGIGPEAGSAADIGATGNTDNAYQAGVSIGSTLSGLGFNLDFAPVADLANVDGSIMKERSYGADASAVSGFVTSMRAGLEEQGVTACLKHFPGIGATTGDTHEGMVSLDRTAEQFWAEELTVFQAGIDAGADMIMISHVSVPALTGDNEPCIFSRMLVTDILREQMHFNGVVITDALNMAAVSEYNTAEEAAVRAILAGCDMLLMPEDFEQAYQGVLKAVQNGNIAEERINDSLKRIYRIKYADQIEQ